MVRRKSTLTLSVPAGTKEQLEALARRLGIFWGQEPSISGLLAAIAAGQFEVGTPFTLNSPQVAALQQAIRLLVDSDYVGQAQILSQLLLDRGKLDDPLRQEILQQVNQPMKGWRVLVDQCCNNQQPFYLFYRNAQGENLTYTARYAQISFEEKRFYLEIWCEETEDLQNPDFPELVHNRCLRLDRIQGLVPLNGPWRQEGLDTIKVYLHFYRGMVKAYESKDNVDIHNDVIGDVRQVVRRVSNPFWLIREVMRYGKNCEVVAPQALREKIRQEVRSLYELYEREIGGDL